LQWQSKWANSHKYIKDGSCSFHHKSASNLCQLRLHCKAHEIIIASVFDPLTNYVMADVVALIFTYALTF